MKQGLMIAVAAGLVLVGGASATMAAPAKKAAPPINSPAARDWSKTVVRTPEGGFAMGNPAAKVTLVEYSSMTCSHCAHFHETGYPALVSGYVKTGKVRFEFRNFIRDPYDMAAALTARCGGTTRFFSMTDGIFASRSDWASRIGANQEKLSALDGKSPIEVLPTISSVAGFDRFAAARGVPLAQQKACLTNQAAIDRLMAMRNDAKDVQGTPTFFINGAKVEMHGGEEPWLQVERALKAKLGS